MTYVFNLLYLAAMSAMAIAGTAVAVSAGPRPMRRPLVTLCALAALWCLADLLTNLATTGQEMRIVAYLSAPVWSVVPYVGLRATYAYVGRRRELSSAWINGLLLLPAAACVAVVWSDLLFVDFTPAGVNGACCHSQVSPAMGLVAAHFTGHLTAGGLVLWRTPPEVDAVAHRRVTRLIFLAVVPAALGGLLFNGNLFAAGVFPPFVASLAVSAAVLIIVGGLLRAELFLPVQEVQRSLAVVLAASELRYRVLIETCPDPIAVVDLTGRILAANQRAAAMLGFASVTELTERGPLITELTTAEGRLRLRSFVSQVLERGQLLDAQLDILRRDGQVVPAEVSLGLIRNSHDQPEAIIGVGRDIGERLRAASSRRTLEGQIQQAQTTESLGLLAGGVAHDFNNLLVGILGHASLARQELPAGSAAAGLVDQLEKVAQQTAATTRQMLAFSGRGKFVVEPVDLSELMVDIGALARASVPRTIAIEYHLAPSLPLVNTDLSQMQQVVMNLLANSAEAIGSAPGGITVATRVTRVGVDPPHDRLTGMAVPAGSYVCLEVTDTGPGLTEASERHLFDPIFTTRGGRRGLGLPAVAGIVRGHHGAVVVQSPPSGGFTVQVLLPCPSSPQLGDSRRLTPRPATSGTYRGTGTVLVVDDEEMVREVARIALVQAGFTVLTAKDGVDGVETVRTRGDELVAVILDLTMPRLDGRAAYAKIRTERPGLPVFIISGYSREEASERLAATGIAGFVQKPFNPPDLVTALRQTLEPRTRG